MSDKPMLINSKRERVDVEKLVEQCRSDSNRILADDEIGTVVYFGDMDIFAVTGLGHPESGDSAPDKSGYWVQKVKQFSVVRFGQNVRHQIGSLLKSLSADKDF